MDRMSFSDAEYRAKRKQTRREKFLAEMDKVHQKRCPQAFYCGFRGVREGR
jgi:hypothetical protein